MYLGELSKFGRGRGLEAGMSRVRHKIQRQIAETNESTIV